MRFEWDAEKARSNRVKHGFSFELATRVWEDDRRRVVFDQAIEGEERWLAIGYVEAFTLLVVVHVEITDDHVRLISARRATRIERQTHEHGTL